MMRIILCGLVTLTTMQNTLQRDSTFQAFWGGRMGPTQKTAAKEATLAVDAQAII